MNTVSRHLQPQAIYVMWLRDLKRFIRARSRLISSVIQPLFFLVILGSGITSVTIPGMPQGTSYLEFLTPGIITMSVMMTSMIAGVSILWDRQFGFLQEVLVAPVSRLSIVIGRILGGATISIFQGLIILLMALLLGVTINGYLGFILALLMMILIGFSSVGLGLIFASRMTDMQGFQLMMNLIVMPLLMLSGAFFPITTDNPLIYIACCNPLFYMVDALRGALMGPTYTSLPFSVDILATVVICTIFILLGTYLFNTSEA